MDNTDNTDNFENFLKIRDIVNFKDYYENVKKFGVKKNKNGKPLFYGRYFRLCTNWYQTIKLDEFINRPINYLEIGAFCGANVITISQLYASHKDSKITVIDPWCDYDDYDEYKNEISSIYKIFKINIDNYNLNDKVEIFRDFSNNILPTLKNEHYDIIYIDGNHNQEYVLEDAIFSFRKLKKNGYIIFDDYQWSGVKLAIDSFCKIYEKYLEIPKFNINAQFAIKKIKNFINNKNLS